MTARPSRGGLDGIRREAARPRGAGRVAVSGAGQPRSPMPSSPCTWRASTAPRATDGPLLVRPARRCGPLPRARRACCARRRRAGALPPTHVTARRSRSGCSAASSRAHASSTPVSTSSTMGMGRDGASSSPRQTAVSAPAGEQGSGSGGGCSAGWLNGTLPSAVPYRRPVAVALTSAPASLVAACSTGTRPTRGDPGARRRAGTRRGPRRARADQPRHSHVHRTSTATSTAAPAPPRRPEPRRRPRVVVCRKLVDGMDADERPGQLLMVGLDDRAPRTSPRPSRGPAAPRRRHPTSAAGTAPTSVTRTSEHLQGLVSGEHRRRRAARRRRPGGRRGAPAAGRGLHPVPSAKQQATMSPRRRPRPPPAGHAS